MESAPKGVLQEHMDLDSRSSLSQLFPSIAAQMRSVLSNVHFAAAAIAPPEAREEDPELDAKAAVMDQSYYQLLRLINNLTVAAGLESEQKLEAKNQDVVALVRDVCEQCASLAEMMGLKFSFSCQEAGHVCAIYRDSIEQLLFQLLSNAFKFTSRGGSVSVELRFSDGRVLLSVCDTGRGIPEELMPTLFERYLHRELMNPPPHGLGLGLPLCRRIAEGHGGTLVAESRVGKGTRVTLSIPDRQSGLTGVSDVHFDYTGGFNRTLLSLADALPAEAFFIRNEG